MILTLPRAARVGWATRSGRQGLLVTAFALGLAPCAFSATTVAIPAGSNISVRTVDAIESHKAEVGQSYRCTVESPVVAGGKQIVPRGADCVLRVVETTESGRLTGKSELKLELAQVRVEGNLVDVSSDPSSMQSEGKGKSTGVKTGIGAAAGAGLGGIFGGKKGALVGAGAGAGAGVATAALTHGPEIKVAPETVLSFIVH